MPRTEADREKWRRWYRRHREIGFPEWYRQKQRDYNRYYRLHHPDRIKKQWRHYYDERRSFIDWLKSIPCFDCGGQFPPECMDFDHRDPSTKRRAPGAIGSLNALQNEIMKCDLVCANCHRTRTFRGGKVLQ